MPRGMYWNVNVSAASSSAMMTVNLDRNIPQRLPAETSHIFGTRYFFILRSFAIAMNTPIIISIIMMKQNTR